ncbi:MAG: tetratricopeptide (TPR) repeat protein [Glaciecola sp.]|jgi:tetratricopeptide (TPR) repeat protein
MILNSRKLRSLALVAAFSVSLSGCSSMPSLPNISGADTKTTQRTDNTPNNAAQSDQTIVNADSVAAISAPIELTPEELEEQALAIKVRGLMGTLNAFKLDKQNQQKLNSSQLRDVQSGINNLASGKTDEALLAVQRVIDDAYFIASPNTAVWVLRGDIYRANDQAENAVGDYKAALELVGSNYHAHNRLAFIYRDAGEFSLAEAHYAQAINAWPGNADSYRNRGILYDLYVGDKVAALEDYKLYKALLDFQVRSVASPTKSLLKEQKLISQWILDIQRQIAILQREQANG